MTPLQLKSYNLALYIYISVYILDCDYKNSWGRAKLSNKDEVKIGSGVFKILT